jgi:outer membrane biogenesis lipoprotein LolB
LKRLLSLGLALAVAACATVATPVVSLEGLPASFEMSGRISVRRAGEGEIARLRWQRERHSDVWVLSTPVGTELARIERGSDGLVVHRPGAAPMAASSFSELTENLLGAALDERLLVAWLHRRPAAGPDGWSVAIDESQQLDGREVARRITASHGETVVKLVVDDYRVLAD